MLNLAIFILGLTLLAWIKIRAYNRRIKAISLAYVIREVKRRRKIYGKH